MDRILVEACYDLHPEPIIIERNEDWNFGVSQVSSILPVMVGALTNDESKGGDAEIGGPKKEKQFQVDVSDKSVADFFNWYFKRSHDCLTSAGLLEYSKMFLLTYFCEVLRKWVAILRLIVNTLILSETVI